MTNEWTSARTDNALTERLAELELALEDKAWMRLSGEGQTEFSRGALRIICWLSRSFYLKNPLIGRGVDVQKDYVFGQGVTITAEDPDVDEVIQAFLADAKNKAELTSHQSMMGKEVELAVDGNLFFVFFRKRINGRTRIRTIPVDEIEDIITNPEDAKDPWFYKRTWSSRQVDLESGSIDVKSNIAYYPDWRYVPKDNGKPEKIGDHAINWDTPVYHVRVGGLPSMRFGVPETYPALDWAKAYKNFLEDWSTIVRAYARFAWNVTTKGGKTGIAAAKAKLASTISSDDAADDNPPPTTGAAFIGQEGVNISPVRTAGATTSAEDGRRLLLMVTATFGFPETFFGDASVGTLATAKSLDRPTELKISSRQILWSDVLKNILDYVVLWAVENNILKGNVTKEDDGTPLVTLEVDPETTEPKSATVRVDFPPILEHDTQASIGAIIDASTLKGGSLSGTIDPITVSRMLLVALGVEDVEAALEILYPDGEIPEEPDEPETEPVFEAILRVSQAAADLRLASEELREIRDVID